MDIGKRIKKYREMKNISQDELALAIFVSRQTISNWETNKSYPDIKSLTLLSNLFNVSLDDFIKGDIEEMKRKVDNGKIKKFNIISFVFLVELLILAISAYPLFKIDGYLGVIVWILLFIITLITSVIAERFKKSNDIQTYKEIISFLENKNLTYEQQQQEIGKRNYQKIFIGVDQFLHFRLKVIEMKGEKVYVFMMLDQQILNFLTGMTLLMNIPDMMKILKEH